MTRRAHAGGMLLLDARPICHFNSDLHIGGDEAEKSLSAKSLSEPRVDEVEIALHPDHYLADGMRHGCA